MKYLIKKAISILDPIVGSISDTFNIADKIHNAPSIRAVENNCKLKGDFAVLTGTITVADNGQKSISYPEGFSRSNSCILSIICSVSNGDSVGTTFDSASVVLGAYQCRATLTNSGINIATKKIMLSSDPSIDIVSFTQDFNYKLVLMKV